jgi:hypothetical protein
MLYTVIPGRVEDANPESRSYDLWIPGSRWRAPRNDESPLIEIAARPTIGRAAT